MKNNAPAQIPQRRLRVAAYCRVHTGASLQPIDYQDYYAKKIAAVPDWTQAGIYIDVCNAGTPIQSRRAFQKMLRDCERGEIDIILVQSLSRFARGISACLEYIHTLRELGVAVIFEKENINTLETNAELYIKLAGLFL